MSEEERPGDRSSELLGEVGPEAVESNEYHGNRWISPGDGFLRPLEDEAPDAGTQKEGLDEETRVGTPTASLLETVRTIFTDAERFVELSCGHDFITDESQRPLPTSLGDMAWCHRCKSRQSVWGVSFTETENEEFRVYFDLVDALNRAASPTPHQVEAT